LSNNSASSKLGFLQSAKIGAPSENLRIIGTYSSSDPILSGERKMTARNLFDISEGALSGVTARERNPILKSISDTRFASFCDLSIKSIKIILRGDVYLLYNKIIKKTSNL
jgi:hypothetical protein